MNAIVSSAVLLMVVPVMVFSVHVSAVKLGRVPVAIYKKDTIVNLLLVKDTR